MRQNQFESQRDIFHFLKARSLRLTELCAVVQTRTETRKTSRAFLHWFDRYFAAKSQQRADSHRLQENLTRDLTLQRRL